MPPTPEEEEPNHTMPPSITGTDSEGSDHEVANKSEEGTSEEQKQKQDQKPVQNDVNMNINVDLSEVTSNGLHPPADTEEEKEEIQNLEPAVNPLSDDHVAPVPVAHAHGGNQSTSTMRSIAANPDVKTEGAPTGLHQNVLPVPVLQHVRDVDVEEDLPRVAAIRENDTAEPVESTQAVAPIDEEGSHPKLNLMEKNVTGSPVGPQTLSLFETLDIDGANPDPSSQKNIGAHQVKVKVACHPSKLTRDNSDSALQPAIHRSSPEMPPNVRHPLRVENELEELYSAQPLCILEEQSSEDSFNAEPEDLDMSISHRTSISTRNTSPVEQTESLLRIPAVKSVADAPPSPYVSVPLPADDSLDTGSVIVAPPGTIVFQQPNGEHAFLPPNLGHYGYPMQMPVLQQGIPHGMMQPIPTQMMAPPPHHSVAPTLGGGGRRKITLRIEEDIKDSSRKSFFFRRRSRNNFDSLQALEDRGIDRGSVSVSWFEGTSSVELQEHVRKSVVRKMNLNSSTQLVDLRIIDQSVDPPEEIVLSPFIPDGSSFLLRFSTEAAVENGETWSSIADRRGAEFSAPQTPSAAPSPYPSNADLTRLNAQLLSGKLNALKPPLIPDRRKSALKNKSAPAVEEQVSDDDYEMEMENSVQLKKVDEVDTASKSSDFHEDDVMGYNPEDQVDARLRQIADILIHDRKSRRPNRARKEKRQVIFVIANYFVLFLSFIAISAELSARSPKWLGWIESQLQSVQKCSTDQDALFECVSKGDFAGLVASFILFLSRSAATKRFFLFGFETPQKLWTVVYESLITAVCWGLSYIVIRRGMNPDTRVGFVRKYWKDAVYGSLAGFNAAFMKQVLKNLIPQDALEDAFQERQLKILSWLPSFQ